MNKDGGAHGRLSRRAFVSATAGGLGAAGAVAALGAPDAIAAEPPRRWDKTVDVVIIGAGAVGLAAGIEAAQHGASVTIVEQNFDVGGHAIQSGANIALGGGTSLQKKHGVVDSPDLLFSDLARDPDFRYNDRELLRAFADWAVPTFDWLVANGVVFPDEPPTGGRATGVKRTHTPKWRDGVSAYAPTGASGTLLVRPLEASARKLGVEILLEHSMTRIVREADFSGAVVGITADHRGKTLNLRARKGVIIGTGGHTSNVSLRRIFDPRLTEEYQVSGEPYSPQSGEGEIAALRIGASLWGAANQTLERGSPLMKPATIGNQFGYMRPANYYVPLEALTLSPVFNRIRALGLTVRDYQNVIHVNQVGQRFVNEAATGYAWFNPCLALNGGASNGGGPIWALFDAEAVKREGWICEPPHVDPNGWFFRGNTLEELARSIVNKYQKPPIPPAALAASVGRYNSLVDAGNDADFGKPAPRYKIQAAPFYAAWSTPVVHDSLTGLRINAKAQVIDLHGQVVPGLYCGGESAGGFSQHGLGRCLVQGRIAGREAARSSAAASTPTSVATNP